MSRAATDWAFDLELPAMQKLVLLVLANRHNSDTGRCDPSLARLAKDCGLGETCVKRTLSALSERGLVARMRRKADGVFASTTYTFQGVRREATNVGAETPNPVSPEATNGGASGDQGVRREATINQEVKPVREPKEEAHTEKRPKLTVIRPSSMGQNIPISEVPPGMPSEAWLNFVAMRKETGKPVTPTAAKLLVGKIGKLKAEGHSPALLLDKATEHQWRSVYPGDDTKAPPPKREYVELTEEEATAQWERDFGRAAGV